MNLAGVVFVYRFCHVNETFHLRRIIKTQTPRAVVRSVSNATMYPQGYVYAVCNQGHYASVNIGYTALPITLIEASQLAQHGLIQTVTDSVMSS